MNDMKHAIRHRAAWAASLSLAITPAACDVAGGGDGAGDLVAPGELLGESVELSTTTALLGANNDAFFFEATADGWAPPVRRQPRAISDDSFYGDHLALGDEFAVIGDLERQDPGRAYVYARDGGNWPQVASLQPPGLSPNALFGLDVAVSGRTVAVGAPVQACEVQSSGISRSDCGAVYVYEVDVQGAQIQTVVRPPAGERVFRFGNSVALDGDRLAVVALGDEFVSDGPSICTSGSRARSGP